MKLTIFLENNKFAEVSYNEHEIYIQDELFAHYTASKVTYTRTSCIIGTMRKLNNEITGKSTTGCIPYIKSDTINNTIIHTESKTVIATYDENALGAIASYIAYSYYLSQNELICSFITSDNTHKKQPRLLIHTIKALPKEEASSKPSSLKSENKKTTVKPVQEKTIIIPKVEPINKEIKYQPPKESEDKPPEYKLPEYNIKDNYKNTNSDGGGGGGGNPSFLLILAIAVFLIINAIRLIPSSWNDLAEFIPKGDVGITVCFISSIIAGIIAILVSIFKKDKPFIGAITAFLYICGISVVINTIVQIAGIVDGTHEFLGSSLIDIPLSFFASILGQFQFALPIGIGTLVVCGIIYAFKMN